MSEFKSNYDFDMALPELIFASPDGGTIHKYQLIGGKQEFLRFISCYLGNCKFHKSIEEAAKFLDQSK